MTSISARWRLCEEEKGKYLRRECKGNLKLIAMGRGAGHSWRDGGGRFLEKMTSSAVSITRSREGKGGAHILVCHVAR